jgi:hypothetical protein
MRSHPDRHTGPEYERTRRAVALLASLALLLAPTMASAAPHKVHFHLPEYTSVELRVPGSNGFHLELTANRVHFGPAEQAKLTDPGPATSTTAFVAVARGPAENVYFGPKATFEGGAIELRLGNLGEAALRFVPRHVTRRSAIKGCTGGEPRTEHGVFVGLLRFDGERGFTRVLRRRIPGTVKRSPPLVCDLVPKPARGPGGTRVTSSRFEGEDGVGFSAERRSPAGVGKFRAYETERRGRVSVQRTIEVDGPAGSVLVGKGLTEATVKPPAPFTGEARFEAFEGKQSGTVLGPLSVSFAGAPDVRLAGKSFEGALLEPGQCSVDRNVTCLSF